MIKTASETPSSRNTRNSSRLSMYFKNALSIDTPQTFFRGGRPDRIGCPIISNHFRNGNQETEDFEKNKGHSIIICFACAGQAAFREIIIDQMKTLRYIIVSNMSFLAVTEKEKEILYEREKIDPA